VGWEYAFASEEYLEALASGDNALFSMFVREGTGWNTSAGQSDAVPLTQVRVACAQVRTIVRQTPNQVA
jgi:hypothetical protein